MCLWNGDGNLIKQDFCFKWTSTSIYAVSCTSSDPLLGHQLLGKPKASIDQLLKCQGIKPAVKQAITVSFVWL